MELNAQELRTLKEWICENFTAIQTYNTRHTSYGLKHYFENSPEGFYITNDDFKATMLMCGYEPKNKNVLNWVFRVSKKSKAFHRGIIPL